MKTIKNILITVLIALACPGLFSSLSLAQGILQWTHTYGGPGQDGGQAMVLTNSGSIVIAGFKSQGSLKDVLIMKADATSGSEIWSRTYNLHLNDIGRAIKQTSDGGFIIAGMTEVTPQIFDPFLIKTDSLGILQWQRQYDYGRGDDDRGHGVWQTSDGGYIIAGQTWVIHGSFGNYDIYVVKTDAAGNVQWARSYFREESGNDVALAVQQLSDGGYIIGGTTQSSSWASFIIRTNSAGDPVWSNIYPGTWQSECRDIRATSDGGFIYTGVETSYQTDADVLIAKLDAGGTLLWKKIYGSVDYDEGESIYQLADGGYVVAGLSVLSSQTGYDMYVLRTNSSGDSLWSVRMGGSGDDRGFGVVATPGGSFYVSGWTWSYGQGGGDVYLAKINESFTRIVNNGESPTSFYLSQNFPNPFNPVTRIGFSLPESQHVNLTIYDLAGRVVETLIDTRMDAGTHELSWDASKFSSGIYFYRIQTEQFSETKKMMLIK